MSSVILGEQSSGQYLFRYRSVLRALGAPAAPAGVSDPGATVVAMANPGAEGLGRASVVNVDNVLTVPKELLEPDPIGRLGEAASRRVDAAIRWALDIRY